MVTPPKAWLVVFPLLRNLRKMEHNRELYNGMAHAAGGGGSIGAWSSGGALAGLGIFWAKKMMISPSNYETPPPHVESQFPA